MPVVKLFSHKWLMKTAIKELEFRKSETLMMSLFYLVLKQIVNSVP